jgi:8-oxo-dGTP pyrophosphatase MutT (NUDIX family)
VTPDPDHFLAPDLGRVRRQLETALGPPEHRMRMLELLGDHGEALLFRDCRPGHLTGSAFVVSHDGRSTLLMHHTKLQMWLQPGGHADGQSDLAAAALREATEETGIEGLMVMGEAIDLDIHRVNPPKEDAHDHLDVRYLVVAPADAVLAGNEESTALRWVDRADLGDYGVDPGTIRMAAAGFERFDRG